MTKHDNGRWYQGSLADTYDVSARQLGICVAEMTARRVSMTFLEFPRFALELDYFLEQMLRVFPHISPKVLAEAWHATVRPEFIHQR
jgi:hypothetical protein